MPGIMLTTISARSVGVTRVSSANTLAIDRHAVRADNPLFLSFPDTGSTHLAGRVHLQRTSRAGTAQCPQSSRSDPFNLICVHIPTYTIAPLHHACIHTTHHTLLLNHTHPQSLSHTTTHTVPGTPAPISPPLPITQATGMMQREITHHSLS